MKVAIIGAGQISRVHGPVIKSQPNVELVAIADKNIARASTLANELGVTRVYDDPAKMIDEQKPDVVHILVPPQLHTDVAVMAMDKGCHVLLEKPMALTLPEAQKMAEAAKRNNVLLCVDHNMVCDQVVQKAAKLFREGVIGDLVSVEAFHVQNAKRDQAVLEDGAQYFYWSYRLNGGPLQDWMPHMASLVFEFIPEIEDIKFIGLNRGVLPQGWQDEIRVLVKSKKATGYISISLSERPDTITLTLKGTKGVIRANLFNGVLVIQKKSDLPRFAVRGLMGFQVAWQNFKGAVANIFKFLTGKVDKSSGISDVVSKFYKAVQEKGVPPVSVENSLKVVELINKVWPVPVVDPEKLKAPAQSFHSAGARPTVLVTGASGFIGIHLIKRLLAEGLRVRAMVRPNSVHLGRLKSLDVEIFEGDLSNPESVNRAMEGIEIVYHAGASMGNSWYEHEQSTLIGTENVIQAALARGVKRLIHLSTLAVHEVNSLKKGTLINESFPYQKNPRRMGPYAFYKIEAEKKILEACQKQGLRATILRLGIVIGPYGKPFFPHLGFKNADTLFLIVKLGRNRLPLTYIENTVEGIYQASKNNQTIGKIYTLVDDGKITVRQYLEKFREVTGIKSKIVPVPYCMFYMLFGMLELAGKMGLLKKGSSRAQFKWKHKNVIYDNTKAKTELGWRQVVPIEEGIKKTFEWYLHHCAS